MINIRLIWTTILIVYICICLFSVATVLMDPKAPLSSSKDYIINVEKMEEISGEVVISHNLNPSDKTNENKKSTEILDFYDLGKIFAAKKPMTSWAEVLPTNDFNQLIDLHNFEYLITQPICSNRIEALILIHSAPKNYENRQLIRETWGSLSHIKDSPLRVLFLFGTVESEEQKDELLAENTNYKDIIQGSFTDSYRNMTYKHIMAFKWYLYNCPQAQILLKTDDDIYVNTPQLLEYLKQREQHKNTIDTSITTPTTTPKSYQNSKYQSLNIVSESLSTSTFNASRFLFNQPENLLFCDKVIGTRVRRSYRSKWRISYREYKESEFPPYCSGYVLIYSPDVVFRLYNAAQNSKYFWVDDVHTTGILAHKTNITITNAWPYILYRNKWDQLLSGKIDFSGLEFIFASYEISTQQIKSLWDLQVKSILS